MNSKKVIHLKSSTAPFLKRILRSLNELASINAQIKRLACQVQRPILILRMIHDRKQIHLLDSGYLHEEIRHCMQFLWLCVFTLNQWNPYPNGFSHFPQQSNVLQNLLVSCTAQPLMTRFVHRLQVDQEKIAKRSDAPDTVLGNICSCIHAGVQSLRPTEHQTLQQEFLLQHRFTAGKGYTAILAVKDAIPDQQADKLLRNIFTPAYHHGFPGTARCTLLQLFAAYAELQVDMVSLCIKAMSSLRAHRHALSALSASIPVE